MSRLLIEEYYRDISDLTRFGGARHELSTRMAFQNLLDRVGHEKQLRLVPELQYQTKDGRLLRPDGTIKDSLRLTLGYWEAKDEADDLNVEIARKLALGYPTDNILFEDTRTAVLVQNDSEVMRASIQDADALSRLLDRFFSFVRPEVLDFRRAVRQFKSDLPQILSTLRDLIATQYDLNSAFASRVDILLRVVKDSINPDLGLADVREMLIQHILTEELFLNVFSESQYHRENNIARELTEVENSFFTGNLRRETIGRLETYYAAIRRTAANTANFEEKQDFLKAVYENFYRTYNPGAADRLAVIYTPHEIVRFMVAATDAVMHRHFGRLLQDPDVHILDPATGTGTYITDVLHHLRGNPKRLKEKYEAELHCNEVGLLAYYIANLNIEYTFAQLTGHYHEFQTICFMDTLDNLSFESTRPGQQKQFNFGVSLENTARITNQNNKDILVVIGNPPYRANQKNENENNKNRTYPGIDKRIKETYIAASRAKKTKAYDMFVRFFRWASDRVTDQGVVAFITNRAFIDRRNLDGMRKTLAIEFSDIYVIDLGGDVRDNPKLSGPKHNVFGIQTGVAIAFLVRRSSTEPAHISYVRRPEFERASEKLSWLAQTRFEDIAFEHIHPDEHGNWLDTDPTEYSSLVRLVDESTKGARASSRELSLFKLYSLGISTNRDEWVYDRDKTLLGDKVRYFITVYDEHSSESLAFDTRIKWSRNLKRRLLGGRRERFSKRRIVSASYRPFAKRWLYDSNLFIDEAGAKESIFPKEHCNVAICISDRGSRAPFCVLAVDGIADLHFGSSIDGYQQLPLYRFDPNGRRMENITDWGLQIFRDYYLNPSNSVSEEQITKLEVFNYVYAVLHDPEFRAQYAVDLRRSFPRIPLYADFTKWAAAGKELLEIHLGYESQKPWPLVRVENSGKPERPVLKADKSHGRIILDSKTILGEVPPEAWTYRLGTRSALEWILDQYKERKSKDPTIAARFSHYNFLHYKEHVIGLLRRVTTVSVRTMEIISNFEGLSR